MENQKILDDSITDNFEWTDPVEIQGAFGNCTLYSFGSSNGASKPKRFKKVFKNLSVSKQHFLKRQMQLKKFEHEFYIPSEYADIKSNKIDKNQVIIAEFTVLNPYVQSIPVSSFIKQKGELYLSNFIAIIQQMVNIMVMAQNEQIYHYHINSNSILLIQCDNKICPQFLLKLTDWGLQNEICSRKITKKTSDFLKKISQSSMFQYLHPELLFEMDNLQIYQNYKSKYDIWSFGIILYRLAYFRRPFQNNGSFSPQQLEKYYKKKQDLKIQNPSLLTALIQKMLSLHQFQTWAKIKAFLIAKCERTECDFLPIRHLFVKNNKVLDYMIEIYKLTGWSMHNSAHIFWYENKAIMQKFFFHLLKLMLFLRFKFIQRFGHRISYLTEQQNKQFSSLFRLIEGQLKRIQFIDPQNNVEKNFFESFQKFMDYLTALQTRIQDFSLTKNQSDEFSMGMSIKTTCKSLKSIKQFSSLMINAKNRMQNCNRKIFQSFFEMVQQKE